MTTVRKIDEALDAYVKDNGAPDVFATGWIIVASVSSPGHEIGNQDGYVTVTSDGLPHHVAIGLLNTSLDDKRNTLMLSALSNFLTLSDEDEID